MERVMNKQNLSISNSKFRLGNEFIKIIMAVLVLMVFFWKVISPQFLYNYNASLIDKMELLENTNEPKIVLIGHSSLSFGIRSELIEEATGKKVVNMGLHGGLGKAFHEEMAKVNVNPGDIYIICHSSYAGDETVSDTSLAWITIEDHPNLWTCVPNNKWYDMLLAYPTYAKKCVNLYLSGEGNADPGETSYSRLSFNKYGDNIYSATHEEHFTFDEGYFSEVPPIDDQCTSRLNKLNEYITIRGGTLLIGGYPIAYGHEKPNEQEWVDFKNDLHEKLDFPIICNYQDYFYPYEYFFNAKLHLTNEAAIIRTNQLIDDINEYLKTQD
jgi:nitrogen fixation-related uncharacterized protein